MKYSITFTEAATSSRPTIIVRTNDLEGTDLEFKVTRPQGATETMAGTFTVKYGGVTAGPFDHDITDMKLEEELNENIAAFEKKLRVRG